MFGAIEAAEYDLSVVLDFDAAVRAEVETVVVELMTAHEVGMWATVYPAVGKSLRERRAHVELVRDAANLEPFVWEHPLV